MPTDLSPVIRRNLKQAIKNPVSQILKSLNDKHLPLPSSQINSEPGFKSVPNNIMMGWQMTDGIIDVISLSLNFLKRNDAKTGLTLKTVPHFLYM